MKEADEKDERDRVAPNMKAGGSHPQATSDPRKKEKEKINQEEVREESGEEKKETRGMRWADCEDDEGKEKEEQEKEKETRQETEQEELTSQKPPWFRAERRKQAGGA